MSTDTAPAFAALALFPGSEEVYREAIAHSSEAIAIIDPAGRYLEQNAAHRDLIGYADRELAGRTPAIHLGEEAFARVAAELARTDRFSGEVATRTRDGRALTLELSAFTVRNERGEVVCHVGIKRDITERKRAEGELHRRYEQLQILYRLTDAVGRAGGLDEIYDEALLGLERAVGASRASILLFDLDGVMRFKAWRGISDGYRRAVEGHSPWRPDAADPRPITIPDVAREEGLGPALQATILAEGIRAVGFFPLVTQGRLLGKFMVYYGAPHPFAPEDVQLAQTIASHVAFAIARTRSERELRFQQALLAAQSEAAVDGILVVSPEREMTSFNRRFAEMWGISDDVLATRSDEAALAAMAAQVEDADGFVARVAHLYAHPGEEARDEVRLKDGRTFDRHTAPLASREWGFHGRAWFFRDVTEQRRAEEEQRFLAQAGSLLASSLDVEATLDAVARLAAPFLADYCLVDVLDEGGALRRVAAAHADPAQAELVNRARAFPPDGRAQASPALRALQTGAPQLFPSLTAADQRRLTGSPEHLALVRALGPRSILAVPLLARGRTLGAITLVMAGSGRRYGAADLPLAEELARRAALAVDNARLYEAAMAANRAKGDFLAVMSHELRTPLNAILGYTDLLGMGVPHPLPEGARPQVERIGVSARHLLQIIEQILAFTRLEAGREEVHRQPVELGAFVRETAALIEPLAAQKRLAFALDLPESPLVVETDAGKLRQILLNLLSNAIKFTDAGEVGVAVEAGRTGVALRVRDTGIGMAPAQLERVFEPFWQADRSRTRVVGGTGLGLSVTRALAELLEGVVEVESEPGRGTTFTIRLPHPKRGERRARRADRRSSEERRNDHL